MTGLRQLNDDLGTRTSEIIERLQVSRGTGRMLVLLVVAFVFFAALRPNIFLSTLNLQNLALSAPEVGVLAIAMMLAMLTGGIDLSLVNIANLSAITMSTLYTTIHGSNPALAEQLVPVLILAGLGMGLLGGAINAVLVAYVGITPILATLGTMQIYNGIAVVWTGGRTLYGSPATLTSWPNCRPLAPATILCSRNRSMDKHYTRPLATLCKIQTRAYPGRESSANDS